MGVKFVYEKLCNTVTGKKTPSGVLWTPLGHQRVNATLELPLKLGIIVHDAVYCNGDGFASCR